MFEAEKEEHKIMKQSTEIEERVSVFEATIDKLDVMIKECKSVEAQTEEKKRRSMTHSSGRKSATRKCGSKSQAGAKAKICEEN